MGPAPVILLALKGEEDIASPQPECFTNSLAYVAFFHIDEKEQNTFCFRRRQNSEGYYLFITPL
jgi:hypothetical protein